MPGQSPGQVKEVQVLHLGRQPADLPGERCQQSVAKGCLLIDQPVEGITAEHLGGDRVERHGGGRPARTVEQGQFAKEATGADRREDGRLRAVIGRERDLDQTGRDDEQGIAGIAGVKDRLALSKTPRPERTANESQGSVIKAREEPTPTQRVQCRVPCRIRRRTRKFDHPRHGTRGALGPSDER